MIVAIDNTFLTVLLNPNAAPRSIPTTGQPVSHCKERIEALIDEISAKNGTLLIPAPALAEALSAAEAIEAYVDQLNSFAAIEIAPFDGRAAFEFGKIIRKAKADGDKRSGQTGEWQYVKMDRAIVAIAVSRSVNVFYTDDDKQIRFAEAAGLTVKSTWDLDLPSKFAQHHLSEHAGTEWSEQKKPPKLIDSETQPAK